MKTNSALLRNAWLLYSDLNSRFNTLLDEYAHLQSTLYGLLPEELEEPNLFEPKPSGRNGIDERTCEISTPYRDVINSQGDHCYLKLSTPNRTYLSYISWLGTLMKGLEENKKTCLATYIRFVTLCKSQDANFDTSMAEEAFFWFVSQRAHFIGDVFGFYARQLEQAHEKLIQVLENFPGASPQPILLRRWNSASYEEYLTGYFAHTKWKVRQLIEHLLGVPIPPGNLTHSWTHVPTSEMNRFLLNWDSDEQNDKEHGAVQSAFFYLEQPALFPLLLHESAHFYFPTEGLLAEARDRARTQSNAKTQPTTESNASLSRQLASGKDFFSLRNEAAETLRHTFPFPVENKDWCDGYTKEIWIDAIAIRLGGVPYVAALFSQMLGTSSPAHYHDIAGNEGVLELFPLGTDNRKAFEVHYPESSDSSVWEARLSLAVRLCKHLGLDRASSAEAEWLDSCSEVIRVWQRGGQVANSRSRTSEEHETFWRYRKDINEWVETVLWSYLEPSVHMLNSHYPSWNYHFSAAADRNWNVTRRQDVAGNPVKSSPAPAIKKAVVAYLAKSLKAGPDTGPLASSLDGILSIDACTVAVRWVVSGRLSRDIVDCKPGADADPSKWLGAFSDYVRHDGHTAFRMAMEWHMVRESIFAHIAKDLREPIPKIQQLTSPEVSHGLRMWLASFFLDKCYDNGVDAFETWLRVDKAKTSASPAEIELIKRLAANCLELGNVTSENAANALFDSIEDGEEISVGTLTLGLIRPAEVVTATKDEERSPYIAALRKAQKYYLNQETLVKHKSFEIASVKSTFLGLIGDYSFLHFFRGVTPVERDVHPWESPKMLTKPRAVIRVSPANRAGHSKQSAQVGKVTLLRREYRHQWLDLLGKLEGDSEAYELYLSSGWEDLILITWHKDMESMQQARNSQDLIHKGRGSHDAQSAVVFFVENIEDKGTWSWNPLEQLAPRPELNSWNSHISFANSSGADTGIRDLYETMGRYDYSITWDCEKTQSPKKMAELLGRLPREFWKPVTTYSTGIRRNVVKDAGNLMSEYSSRFVLC